MTIVNLPLLNDSEPAIEANRRARKSRFSGVVSTDGTHFWLHRFSELLKAVQDDPSRPLSHVARLEIKALHTPDAASGGLDFSDPKPALLETFLRSQDQQAMVITLTENLRTKRRIASVLMFRSVAESYAAYKSKSYKCSAGGEIIDEDELPADGKCREHKGGAFDEQ